MRQDLRPDTDEIGDLILTRLRLDDGVLRGSTGELVLCDGLPCTSVSLRPCTETYSIHEYSTTFTVAMEKRRQLTVHRLRIIMQITA